MGKIQGRSISRFLFIKEGSKEMSLCQGTYHSLYRLLQGRERGKNRQLIRGNADADFTFSEHILAQLMPLRWGDKITWDKREIMNV